MPCGYQKASKGVFLCLGTCVYFQNFGFILTRVKANKKILNF